MMFESVFPSTGPSQSRWKRTSRVKENLVPGGLGSPGRGSRSPGWPRRQSIPRFLWTPPLFPGSLRISGGQSSLPRASRPACRSCLGLNPPALSLPRAGLRGSYTAEAGTRQAGAEEGGQDVSTGAGGPGNGLSTLTHQEVLRKGQRSPLA